MFIAGIDGGGTSTKLEIRTAENRFVRRESFGAFNISAIGEEGFAARLREVLAACGDMADCAAICFGSAGISVGAAGEIIRRELADAGFAGRLILRGDHEIALRGKHGSPQSVAIQRCFGGAGIRALRIGEKHIDAVIAEPGEERTARLQIAREHDLRHGARRGGDGNTDIHNNLTVPVRSGRLSWIGSCRWRREWPLPPFPADRKR